MTIHIPLSPETESRLRQRAAMEGSKLSAYAARLLEDAMRHPDLEELLAPLRGQFAEGGESDEQLIGHITQARDAYRKLR
jgi:hypothetical protein